MAVVYTDPRLELEAAGLVRAEGRADASIIVRRTNDRTLLVPMPFWPAAVDGIPLVDPVQQWWDLFDLRGGDRREAADRLRRAILDRAVAWRRVQKLLPTASASTRSLRSSDGVSRVLPPVWTSMWSRFLATFAAGTR